jgi:hypothetical protein
MKRTLRCTNTSETGRLRCNRMGQQEQPTYTPFRTIVKRNLLIYQGNYLFQRPNVIRNSRFHSGGDPQCLVNPWAVGYFEIEIMYFSGMIRMSDTQTEREVIMTKLLMNPPPLVGRVHALRGKTVWWT